MSNVTVTDESIKAKMKEYENKKKYDIIVRDESIKRKGIGKWMYNWVTKGSLWLSRHKVVYVILTYTWALIPTLLLSIPWYILWMFKKYKTKKYPEEKGHRYFIFGKNWGGVTLGNKFIVDDYGDERTKMHELGHTYQNALLGIFMLFLVSIPSAIRYWYREFKYYKGGVQPPTKYDAIWFEGSATDIGNTIMINYYRDRYDSVVENSMSEMSKGFRIPPQDDR